MILDIQNLYSDITNKLRRKAAAFNSPK